MMQTTHPNIWRSCRPLTPRQLRLLERRRAQGLPASWEMQRRMLNRAAVMTYWLERAAAKSAESRWNIDVPGLVSNCHPTTEGLWRPCS